MFFEKIYDSWKKKQEEKYKIFIRAVKKHVKERNSLIDVGIGRGWFEQFMKTKGLNFKKIVGVDPKAKVNDENIKIIRKEKYSTSESFDLLVCIDTLHLIDQKYLDSFNAKYLLISVPKKFKNMLDYFRKYDVLEEGEAGEEEKDYYLLVKKVI